MAKVTFDGENKLITVNNGITQLDAEIDLYSDWKEWALIGDNLKYLPALSAIGGEDIGGGRFNGKTFFVLNGWKLRPYEGSHTLTISGNIFGEGGTSFIIPVLGSYTVSVQFSNSNLAQGVATNGSDLSLTEITDSVANRITSDHGQGLYNRVGGGFVSGGPNKDEIEELFKKFKPKEKEDNTKKYIDGLKEELKELSESIKSIKTVIPNPKDSIEMLLRIKNIEEFVNNSILKERNNESIKKELGNITNEIKEMIVKEKEEEKILVKSLSELLNNI